MASKVDPRQSTRAATFPTFTSAEIRRAFLDYFEGKGAKLFRSSALVPEDASLLLTNAGMNQFKQYFLGTKTLKGANGATSCQKCLRTNDIDVIGLDGRHLSFFEMLGNFSFGGYTKRDACAWALTFCLDVLSLPQDKLYFTIYKDDDEAFAIWTDLGIAPDHITRLGEDDNFWAAGPTGPCGPCSEIYFDQGHAVGCGSPDCAPGCECDRYLEFWNLVFTQYDRQEDGTLKDLPHQNVDTGMGLERMAAIMQHKSSNYDGDILHHLIELGEKLSGKKYGATAQGETKEATKDADKNTAAEDAATDISLRIIADHSRAVTFMIADGILPSNEGRGYVLRRLLRRAIFHGRLLGITRNFLVDFVAEITRLMGDTYPELLDNAALIDKTVTAEEERFQAVIEKGQNYLEAEIAQLKNAKEQDVPQLSGEVAFVLHDTYGFPLELTKEICAAAGIVVDEAGFQKEMDAQKERARKAGGTEVDAWKNVDVWTELSENLSATSFLGYETTKALARVIQLVNEAGETLERIGAGETAHIVLDQTPFYAERGGQVADSGVLISTTDTTDTSGLLANVSDVQDQSGLYVHTARIEAGSIAVGDEVTANVDVMRRALIERNHTATHLLDAALIRELGDHVHQAGSLVSPERLRFDFTHFEALTPAQLQNIERAVNDEIAAALPVTTEIMSIDEAKASGAVAQFSEKYGDTVRVVSVDDVSKELCGGTHVTNTSEIGFFKIIAQSSVGAAARRIEAVTSLVALSWVNERLTALSDAAAALKVPPTQVPSAIEDLQAHGKEMKKRLSAALAGKTDDDVVSALGAAIQLKDYKMVIARLDGKTGQELRAAWDVIKQRAKDPVAAFLLSETPEKKAALLAAGTNEAVAAGFDAGALLKRVVEKFGGRGGGRANMAQGAMDVAGDANSAVSFLKDLMTSNED